MKILFPALLSFFLTAFLATPALAELYQWKDENGRVHFSDTKPGSSSANVNTVQQPDAQRPSGRKNADSSNTGSSSSQERQQRLLQVMKQESEQKEKERQSAERSRQQREAECNKLREHQSSSAGRRLFHTDKKDENGDLIYLDDKERAAYDQQIANAIAENCQ
ncbi:MAG: DUF4124 domain-containing protein [Pedobacter sp.]|nr:DUF4124 domain-containing protein [Pedobacter sp.]